MAGSLYLVATPVGNLNDLSDRVKDILRSADILLAEDTRVTIRLLNHLGIKKHLISCHQHNEKERTKILAEAAEKGWSVALVSDAGTPLISDPGDLLVTEAISLGLNVIPIAGPSAFLLALVGSGLRCDRFAFEGFLPDKPKEMKDRLISLVREQRTLIFYISPHKLNRTVSEMLTHFHDRKACLARELTKLHEEFIRGTVQELSVKIENTEIRGECVLILEGFRPDQPTEEVGADIEEFDQYVKYRLEQGDRASELAQDAAKLFGRKRSDVYKLIVDFQKDRQNRLGECDNS
ncbi:MAG: 16S rRNA (cytidine(1402)-2'-O)-methyltransferase [Leptolyngbya sp.]|nr:16S rRNA (cytidine(1402)-2'-O)-methyltransferase [Candidatus Melainabacteria bacterium]